jgi:hypothetical protein
LGLERIVNKKQEKMVALLLLAYEIGLLVGEALREEIYSGKSRSFIQGYLPYYRETVTVTLAPLNG